MICTKRIKYTHKLLIGLLLALGLQTHTEELSTQSTQATDLPEAITTNAALPVEVSDTAPQPEEKKKCCGAKRREKKEKAREKKQKKREEAQKKKEEAAEKKRKEQEKRDTEKKEELLKKQQPQGEARPTKETKKKKTPRVDRKPTQDMIEELYVGISGYNIPKEEVEIIKTKGGAPTYGEIKYHSLQTVFDDLPKSNKKGAFYDFGSGVGKVVVQAYLDVPQFKKTVGWEISEQRAHDAQQIVNKMQQKDLIDKNRNIEFHVGDFLQAPIDDARVIYMCSTCYSDETMLQLTDKFSKLNKGLIVITLKPLPNYKQYGFVLTKEYKLAMTWWHASPVYVYELKNPIKEPKATTKKKSEPVEKKEDKK